MFCLDFADISLCFLLKVTFVSYLLSWLWLFDAAQLWLEKRFRQSSCSVTCSHSLSALLASSVSLTNWQKAGNLFICAFCLGTLMAARTAPLTACRKKREEERKERRRGCCGLFSPFAPVEAGDPAKPVPGPSSRCSKETRALLVHDGGAVWCLIVILAQIPFYNEMCEKLNAGENCKTLVGYSAVYKVCFGMSCFFLLFCIFTIRVNTSRGCRAAVHNG